MALTKEDLQAMQEIMTAVVQPINERLEKVEVELHQTRILVEGNQRDMKRMAEHQQVVIKKLDNMANVKSAVADNKDRISTVETVVKSHSQRIKVLEESAV